MRIKTIIVLTFILIIALRSSLISAQCLVVLGVSVCVHLEQNAQIPLSNECILAALQDCNMT